ncbi:MAG: D-arabinose 5-phosphate isomerase [Gammaproteobacteria bacterium TMED119]|nr:MAG: D-arabinose 5-phosphate isomerase [Gammaproteobacteria bacterium TMED119]RCL47263.1 MAG: KpsF/GutQ family sugar-phosphate isomerase [Candidatus Thioglobus sp.]
MSSIDPKITQQLAQQLIAEEAQAVADLLPRINDHFVTACEMLLNISGRIVVIGIGKSGHISRKIAATMASTGSPAFFVSAAEASHGDLGMICQDDAVIMLSNSGESQELLTLLSALKAMTCPIVTLTGNLKSSLAVNSHCVLDVSVTQEACPLGLAPTTSTAAMLAMGDALAICLLNARGFDEEDFARSHPGGKLGKRLLTKVQDIMHTGEAIPNVQQHQPVKDGLLEISSKGLGMTTVSDADNHLVGIFTDGDLRRLLENDLDLHTTNMQDVMNSQCQVAHSHHLAVDSLQQMQKNKINALPVVNAEREIVGAFNMHDLLSAGIV